MKNIKSLKTSIEVFYTALHYGVYFGIATMGYLIFAGDRYEALSIPVSELSYAKIRVGIIALLGITVFYLFTRGVFHLMHSMEFFEKGDYFNEAVSKRFNKASSFFIWTGIGVLLWDFLSPLVLVSRLEISIGFKTIASSFLVIIGLFFRFFGAVFIKARGIQEENELTV